MSRGREFKLAPPLFVTWRKQGKNAPGSVAIGGCTIARMNEGTLPEPDPADVLATIGWEGAGFERVTRGWYNLIWKFEGPDGRAYGLRMARPQASAPGLFAAIDREVTSITTVALGGLPVPKVEACGEFQGVPFMVQRWLPGVPMLDIIGDRPWRLPRLAVRFGRLQARLHSLSPGDLHVLPAAEWERHVVPYSPELAEVIHREARTDAICHLDFHPLNVLVNPSNDRISALVDLTNCAVADRRMDVGLTDALVTVAPLPPEPLKAVKNLLRGRFAAGWRKGYAREAGNLQVEPAFAAFGAAHYLFEFEIAVREGRGWATERDLQRVREELDRRLAKAGLPPSRPPI